MREPLHLVLVILAFLCFCLAATNFVGGENRVRLIALGLAVGSAAYIF